MSRRTSLHQIHLDLGATMTDFAGWAMPVRYDSDLAEHHAVRKRAGLFDLSHMGEIEVVGEGAPAALDHAFVGQLSAVEVGRAKYTMLCADDGGVLDDVVIYRRGEHDYLVVANASNAAVVCTELTARSAGFDAQVRDVGEQTALLALQGPASVSVLEAMGVEGLGDLRYYAGVDRHVAELPIFLARTGYTGEDGFELYVDAPGAPQLWQAIMEAGAMAEVVPAGLACRDTLRLEAGMPLYGQELGPDRTPFDAGMGRIVALKSETDFVGREALEQVAATGPTDALVGLIAEGRRAPRAGYAVQDADGASIGVVTSGALSPTLGTPIAMAYVPIERSEPGTALTVDVRGSALDVQVVDLPFYRRER